MSTKETSADKTKYRLAEAAKKCMASSGTDAMTVTQIVQTCGVTRQTFYRNFQDKYDLITGISTNSYWNLLPRWETDLLYTKD